MPRYLLLLVVFAGCVTVSKSVIMDRSNTAVPGEDVYVFLASDIVPDSCERVALLHASGAEDFTAGRVAAKVFDTNADRDEAAVALWCPKGVRRLNSFVNGRISRSDAGSRAGPGSRGYERVRRGTWVRGMLLPGSGVTAEVILPLGYGS